MLIHSNFFLEENNPKLMPSIAFSSLEVPQKCVGGRVTGEVKRSPEPLAEF